MVGISEVLRTMVAMIIFSMMLLNANRMIYRNTMMQIDGELEQEVVALAQDIIEEGRTKEFDEVTVGMAAPPADIPGDFTASSSLGRDGEVGRENFDDFDDYNNWEETLETEHGNFNIEAQVFYVARDGDEFVPVDTASTFKQMKVNITSEFLTKSNSDELTEYHLEFIRNYYAD